MAKKLIMKQFEKMRKADKDGLTAHEVYIYNAQLTSYSI